MPLLSIGLLHDEYRLRFCLSPPKNATAEFQTMPAEYTLESSSQKRRRYRFNVTFKSTMRGRYEQWIIFDFGQRPVVRRKLIVHTGVTEGGGGGHDVVLQNVPPHHPDEEMEGVWDGSNTRIIPYGYPDEEIMELETKYKLREFQVDVGIESTRDMSKENYKHIMQYVLSLEEKARQDKLLK